MIILDLPDSLLFARAVEADRLDCRRRRRPYNRPSADASRIERNADGSALIRLFNAHYFPLARYQWDGRQMVRLPAAGWMQ